MKLAKGLRDSMKRVWKRALQGKLYDPDVFDAAVEWLDEAYAFIALIAKQRGQIIGFHEPARELKAKADGHEAGQRLTP